MSATPEGITALGEVDAKPEDTDQRFYSVTTILGALDKPALLYWAAEQTALQAVAVAGSLPVRIEEEGQENVVKWLRDARFRPPKGQRSATELGTAVHDACERYAITGIRPEVDEEVLPFLDRFDEWVQVWQPKYEAAEAAVYSPTYGYAGTLDAIAEIDGQRVLLDYKSSRKSVGADGKPSHPYPEVALQLAAYRHADLMATWRARRFSQFRRRYYLLSPGESSIGAAMPKVDGGIVVHITPDHCDAYPVLCDEAVFRAFCYVIEVFRWTSELSKVVIGDPLERGGHANH
jgi:hypothetical protein